MPGSIVKCLSLWQPWATLLAAGVKRFETRGWSMHHRGLLLIHAARVQSPVGISTWHATQSYERPELSHFEIGSNFFCLPFGAVVGAVEVVDCRPTEELLDEQLISEAEFRLGDYSPGRYGIRCANTVLFQSPVPMKGRQGLWNIDLREHPAIVSQLGRS